MKKGRPPKPNRLKLLEGNPGGRSLRDDAPVYPALDIDNVPSDIGQDARSVWFEVGRPLVAMGLLQSVDYGVFWRYCDIFGRWLMMRRYLQAQADPINNPCGTRYAVTEQVYERGPKGNWLPKFAKDGSPITRIKYYKPLPEIAEYHKLGDSLLKLESELGLTPATRSKLKVSKSFGRFGDEDDPFA